MVKPQTKRLLARHLVVGALGAAALVVFWMSRPNWSAEMRLWKSFGDAALVLLIVTLVIGPSARLSRPWARLLPWRRETGIWFGILAAVHTLLILNGWARWSVAGFFGYEMIPELGRMVRMEPGFGLANLLGLIAMFWTLLLVATSSDRATRGLGMSAWRWLHYGVQVIFYLVVAHTAYFLFIHYTLSFHKPPVPADWFRVPFLGLSGAVMAIQTAAFVKTVRSDKRVAAMRAAKAARKKSTSVSV